MNNYYIKDGMKIKSACGVCFYDPAYSMEDDEYADHFYIVKENMKHGIVYNDMENIVLPIEYDDVCFVYSSRMNYTCDYWYKLSLGGKFGLCKITFDVWDGNYSFYLREGNVGRGVSLEDSKAFQMVVECECDSIVKNSDDSCFILSDKNGFRYITHDYGDYVISRYYKEIWIDINNAEFLYAYDDEKRYLIKLNGDSSDVVYESSAEEKNMHYFIGDDNIIDFKNNQLLIKYKTPVTFRYRNITPISLVDIYGRKRNIANIIKVCEKTGCVGAVDKDGEVLFEPVYDNIAYELKLTARKNGKKTKKVIPIDIEHRDK